MIDPLDNINHWNGHVPQLPQETPPAPGMTPGGRRPEPAPAAAPRPPLWLGSSSLRGDLPVRVPQTAPVAVTVKPPLFIGDGTGLLGSYYFGLKFDRLAFKRADRNIDFAWSGASPDLVRLPIGNAYTVLWHGSLIPRYSETYTLYTDSDDGVRVWIDGRLVIDDWSIHGEAEDAAALPLVAGQPYDLRVEYFEKNGRSNEVIKLYWQSPSQPREFIPESQLRYPKNE